MADWRTWRATLIRWIAGNRSFIVNTVIALEGPMRMTDMHMVNSVVWIYNKVTPDDLLHGGPRTDGYPGLTIGPKELSRGWTPPVDSL
jgi:hypothetical protein